MGLSVAQSRRGSHALLVLCRSNDWRSAILRLVDDPRVCSQAVMSDAQRPSRREAQGGRDRQRRAALVQLNWTSAVLALLQFEP